MNESSLLPTSITSPPEEIQANYLRARHDSADPAWSIEIALNRAYRVSSLRETPPDSGAIVTLGLFNRQDPPCDIEVYGVKLSHDVHPADWLDTWVEQRPFTVLARKRVPTISGAVGDLAVMWESEGKSWMGRLFAMKFGPRLLLVWARTAAPDYPRVAESIFVTLSSLKFLDESTGPLAEPIRWIESKLPRPWRTAIPVSWEIKDGPVTDSAATFEAGLMMPRPEGDNVMVGKLTHAVIARHMVDAPAEIIEELRRPMTDSGAVIANMTPVEEPHPGRALAAWSSIANGMVRGVEAEFRCRVLRYPDCWVATMMMMFPRKQFPDLWMRCRRLMDIAVETTELR